MTAQPHPFRCETCAHFQTSGKGMSPDCDQISHWLTEGDRKLIIEVGCASHSASSQRIEQVIKMLEQWKRGEMVDLTDNTWYVEIGSHKIDEAIALLREGAGK